MTTVLWYVNTISIGDQVTGSTVGSVICYLLRNTLERNVNSNYRLVRIHFFPSKYLTVLHGAPMGEAYIVRFKTSTLICFVCGKYSVNPQIGGSDPLLCCHSILCLFLFSYIEMSHSCISLPRMLPEKGLCHLHLSLNLNFFFFFGLFRATPAAHGSSWAMGWIGAVATGLPHSHSNAIWAMSATCTTVHGNARFLTHGY